MYTKELCIQLIQNRINILEARGPHNAKIVAKLQRRLRALSRT